MGNGHGKRAWKNGHGETGDWGGSGSKAASKSLVFTAGPHCMDLFPEMLEKGLNPGNGGVKGPKGHSF